MSTLYSCPQDSSLILISRFWVHPSPCHQSGTTVFIPVNTACLARHHESGTMGTISVPWSITISPRHKENPWNHCNSKGFYGGDGGIRTHVDCSKLISSQPRYDHFDTSPYDKYAFFRSNHMISSQPRYDHFDTAAYYTTLGYQNPPGKSRDADNFSFTGHFIPATSSFLFKSVLY